MPSQSTSLATVGQTLLYAKSTGSLTDVFDKVGMKKMIRYYRGLLLVGVAAAALGLIPRQVVEVLSRDF